MEKEGLNPLDSALDTAREKLEGAVEALTEQAYNELVAIRRGKLAELQESGSDPFERTSWPQTHFAAQVKAAFVDPPEGERGPDVCMAGRMMSQKPAAAAGKIPRPARPRGALPPALCGSDRQPGREGYVP